MKNITKRLREPVVNTPLPVSLLLVLSMTVLYGATLLSLRLP